MTPRIDKETTSEEFFKVYSKVPNKTRRQITKKAGIKFTDKTSVGIKSSGK